MSIADQKAAQRLAARERRRHARAAAGDRGHEHFTGLLLEQATVMGIEAGAVVAGYWAMADEIDVIPAMTALRDSFGVTCALPVVVRNGAPLLFRAWQPGDQLDSGGFGTHHPQAGAPEVTPDVLLVPLLAFDKDGYRMGWGGGFYDRTLEQLRKNNGAVIAVGVAYAGQAFDAVVRDGYDQPMDWIVTEQSIRKVGIR